MQIDFLTGWSFNSSLWNITLTSKKDVNLLIGWSLGGLKAIQACIQQPNHYSHLILVSSTPRFLEDTDWIGMSKQQADKQYAQAKADMSRYQQQFMRLACYPDKTTDLRRFVATKILPPDTSSLISDLNALFSLDLRHLFASISIPVLQIMGEKDLVITPQQSLQSNKLLHHEHHVIPDAGHMLLATHPQTVARLIQEFIC